jgi:uncharacterized protein (DUF1800 family)
MTASVEQTRLALQRFGLGPRPGDLAAIGADIREHLRAEISEKRLVPLQGELYPSQQEAGPAFFAFQENERREREARRAPPVMGQAAMAPAGMPQDGMAMPAPPPAPAAPPQPPMPQRTYREEARARFHAMLEPRIGFSERLVMFWANHFAVSVNKGNPVRAFAGLMEREAIRPHIHGRFADMLLAVEAHPAMLYFLDNQLSIGPGSQAGQRRGRGLNENLAREILELHTLGVAGGYTQTDVTSLARIITGWTFVGPNGQGGPPGTFLFNANMHEPGEHALLGQRYGQAGMGKGRAALADLARHPQTAQHIARKLARHFVADDPPASLVARLAKTFRDSDGDLQAVSHALIEAPEAWDAQPRKIRTPQEFFVAACRALGRKPDIGQILQPLNAMGQPLWQPGGPNGFPDIAAAWASPEGLKTRLDVAAALGRQSANQIDPRAWIGEVFGEGPSPETRQAVLRAETRHQAIALALMSPEFQRR